MLLASFFYEFDRDNSGKLDYQEFKHLMTKLCRLPIEQPHDDSSDSSEDSFEAAYRRKKGALRQ